MPQVIYRSGIDQECWEPKPPIYFHMWGSRGVRLLDALCGNLLGMEGSDELPFGVHCSAIMIRIHVSLDTESLPATTN